MIQPTWTICAISWKRQDTAFPGTSLPVVNRDHLADCQLLMIEGSRCEHRALSFCRQLRMLLADKFVPILFVTDNHTPGVRLASLESGADTYLLRPFAPGELLAQVRAFLRIKELHDGLIEKSAEVIRINKRLQTAHERTNGELELARRIQMSFLPHAMPEMQQVRFAVHYLLCGRVGGDFYDVFRLDENHVGFYVADAMGHGVPASLLTVFIKKGVRAKEIFGQQYRLVPPGEVLQRLNRELIEEAMPDNPFITMVYALLDFRTGNFQFSRAGHPYPLYVPQAGKPELLQVSGSLLGVFEAEFPERTHQLHPGDKLLFYTDGIDGVEFKGQPPGSKSLLACAAQCRELPIQEFVQRMARDLSGQSKPQDDLTLLGMEVLGK